MPSSWQFEAIGTTWEIIVPGGIYPLLRDKISQRLEAIDHTWSRFRSDSLVTEMSQSAGTYPMTANDQQLLTWYQKLYTITDGAVTPLIGQTLADAGYDSHYSLRQKTNITITPPWSDVLQLHINSLHIKQPTLLDVGAAGKGWAIDQIGKLLGDHYLIDAGGDIRTHGIPQTIGLEDPNNPERVIGTITLAEGSVCGSAGNRRAWTHGTQQWHHIIDPATSRPSNTITASWVSARSAMVADGLATALFFVQPQQLQSLADFEYVIIQQDGSVIFSKSNNIRLFQV